MIDAPERQLNIKDFVIEGPVKMAEHPFDPKTDIPQVAWDAIRQNLHMYRADMGNGKNSEEGAVSFASDLKLLEGPDAFSSIPEFTEDEWGKIDTRLEDLASREEWVRYLLLLKNIHIIDPIRAKEERYQIDKEQKREIKDSEIAGFFKRNNDSSALHCMSLMKIISPEERFNIPFDFWEKIKNGVENIDLEKQASVKDRYIARSVVLGLINNVKILDPERAKSLFSEINYSWTEIREELTEFASDIDKPGSVSQLADYAQNLLLYSADEIKVGENGLELVMPKPEADLIENNDLPKMRNF